MALYAARLWQGLKSIWPEWIFDSMSPLGEKMAGQPNKYLRNLSDFIASPLFLKWGIKQSGYDLLHIIDHSYAYLLDYLDKGKSVVTCHDLMMFKLATGEIGPRDQAKIKSATVKRNIDRIKKIGQAARIVAVSNNTKHDLVKYLGIDGNKIEVIYSGLNYDFHPIDAEKKRIARKRYGFNNERLMLCVGNNQFYKNLEGIIEALAMKLEYLRQNNLVLLKAGSDFSDGQKRMIERYGLQPHVIHIGYVNSFDHLNELYNLAELFLFPSLYEGFGWPPLEAMACGTPVIASEAGSLKEVLNGAAYTVDPVDYQQMAQALIEVLENESVRRTLIDKGFANAARFNWLDAAKAHVALYTDIVNACKAIPRIR
jgi:glycosyltransferase involved in cell wall biosynthesis